MLARGHTMESSTMIASGLQGDMVMADGWLLFMLVVGGHDSTISEHRRRGVANVWTLRMAPTIGECM